MTLKAKVYYPGLTVGSILVLADGRRLLVGDINQQGGVCDDCCPDKDCEVVRILQKKEEE